MIQRALMAAAIALLADGGIVAAAAQAPTKTTNSGVYTAAQAERGKKTFEREVQRLP